MTPQSMILKTKKRLSDDSWTVTVFTLGVVGLSLILSFLIRVPSLPRVHGYVRADIPVLEVPANDPSLVAPPKIEKEAIARTTPTVALTFDAFYFGSLEAFGSGFYRQDNKFRVRHDDGEPQLGNLLRDLERWLKQPQIAKSGPHHTVLLMPMSGIPMPIVIQVIEGLRAEGGFKHVVLTNGVI